MQDMGERFLFVCSECGYDADVSGGRDAGLLVTVQTGSCAECSQLVDVVIDVSRRGDDSRLQTLLDRCPSCGSREWTPWGMAETYAEGGSFPQRRSPDENVSVGPCPKCGGAMFSRGPTVLWD